jgi:MOSC domain-containing protein YiiM
MKGEIVEVCISTQRGIGKTPVGQCEIRENYGLVGDAHANSKHHRQVCLLDENSIEKMKGQHPDCGPGSFAENLTTRGMDLLSIPVGAKVRVGEVVLEITQKGKERHEDSPIYRKYGEVITWTEGIFGRVLKGGTVKAGDPVETLEESSP